MEMGLPLDVDQSQGEINYGVDLQLLTEVLGTSKVRIPHFCHLICGRFKRPHAATSPVQREPENQNGSRDGF